MWLDYWNNSDAVRILARAREALAPAGRLLVVERVASDLVENRPEHCITARSDLNTLVGLGGRERTVAHYDGIIASAGLSRRQLLPAVAAFSIIEATVCDTG